jgi:hypothetical protein
MYFIGERKTMANRGKQPTKDVPSKLGQILTAVQKSPIYPTLKTLGYWEQYTEREQESIYLNAKNLLPSGIWGTDTDDGSVYSEEEQSQIIKNLADRWFVGNHEILSLEKVCQMFFEFWQYDGRVEPTKFKYRFNKHKLYGLPNGAKNVDEEILYFVAPFTDFSVKELIEIAEEDKRKLLAPAPRNTGFYRPNFGIDRNNTHMAINDSTAQYNLVETTQKPTRERIVTPLTDFSARDNTFVRETAVGKGATMLADDSELIKLIQNKIYEEGIKAFLNAGMSRDEVSAILGGQEPKLSSGYRLAEALEMPLEEILELASRTWNNN